MDFITFELKPAGFYGNTDAMNHSPGPWTFEPEKLMEGIYHVAGRGPTVWFGPEPGPLVRYVTVHGGEDNPSAEANARLIAAAPELFTALERLHSIAGGFDEDSLEAALDQALEALAKASG